MFTDAVQTDVVGSFFQTRVDGDRPYDLVVTIKLVPRKA
jgi:hypothetical protein